MDYQNRHIAGPKRVPRPRLLEPPARRYTAIQAGAGLPEQAVSTPDQSALTAEQQPGRRAVTQELPAARKTGLQLPSSTTNTRTPDGMINPHTMRYLRLVPQRLRPAVDPLIQYHVRRRLARTRDNEQILVREHMHWIFLVRSTALPLLATFGSAAAIVGLSLATQQSMVLFGLLLVLIPAAGMWLAYNEWRNDAYLVTTRRVIDVRRQLITLDRRTEIVIEMVQNVHAAVKNLWQRFFNYGNVTIDNAGLSTSITFTNIPKPEQVREQIWRAVIPLRQEALQKKQHDQKNRLVEAIIAEEEPTFTSPPTEKVLAVWRKSIYMLVVRLFKPGLLLFGYVLIYIVILTTLTALVLYSTIAFLVLLLIGGGWFLWAYVDWENDQYILTDMRLTSVHRIAFPIGYERRTDLLLSRVQDVKSEMVGMFAVLLNYGEVSIESAGGAGPMHFAQVDNPQEVARMINDQVKELRRREEESTFREQIETARTIYQLLREDIQRVNKTLVGLEHHVFPQGHRPVQTLHKVQPGFTLLQPPPRPAAAQAGLLAEDTTSMDDGIGMA